MVFLAKQETERISRPVGVPNRIVVVCVTKLTPYGFPLAGAWFAELLSFFGEARRGGAGRGGSAPPRDGRERPPCDGVGRPPTYGPFVMVGCGVR